MYLVYFCCFSNRKHNLSIVYAKFDLNWVLNFYVGNMAVFIQCKVFFGVNIIVHMNTIDIT